MDNEEILKYFYEQAEIILEDDEKATIPYSFDDLKGELSYDLVDAKTKKLLLKKGERLTNRHNRSFIENGLTRILVPQDEIYGRYFSNDIYDEETGVIFAEAGEEIDEVKIEKLIKSNIKNFKVIIINEKAGPYVRNTFH